MNRGEFLHRFVFVIKLGDLGVCVDLLRPREEDSLLLSHTKLFTR